MKYFHIFDIAVCMFWYCQFLLSLVFTNKFYCFSASICARFWHQSQHDGEQHGSANENYNSWQSGTKTNHSVGL